MDKKTRGVIQGALLGLFWCLHGAKNRVYNLKNYVKNKFLLIWPKFCTAQQIAKNMKKSQNILTCSMPCPSMVPNHIGLVLIVLDGFGWVQTILGKFKL